jgi:hypothetical protein
MREKDKEDVTAHEYLITPPPAKKKNGRNTKKKTRESTAICTGRGYTHKKQNTHALVEKQREMFLLLALPFT